MPLGEQPFIQFPELYTSRLTLRKLIPSDAPGIFRMRSNPVGSKFIYRPLMKDISEAEMLLKEVDEKYKKKECIAWAGLLRDGKQMIGSFGYNRVDTANHRGEIGGELMPEYWGKKIAFEAAETVIHFGRNWGLHTIEAKILPQNRGGIYILEQLGFVKEAHFHEYIFHSNTYHDLCVYTLINN